MFHFLQFCKLYLVKFCPHDLFVNTRADLGACSRVHDDEARDLFEKAVYSYRKQQYEDEFIRFCQSMLNEVERKIIKGKQRLALIGRTEAVSYRILFKFVLFIHIILFYHQFLLFNFFLFELCLKKE